MYIEDEQFFGSCFNWEGTNSLPGERKGFPGGLVGREKLYRLTVK